MISIPENIQKELDDISNVAKDLKMKLYVVGGFSRDIVMGVGISEDTDLDVTEENGNAFDLAFFVSAKYDLAEPVIYPSSGTAMVTMASGRKIEFHNAQFLNPHIIDQLYVLGVEPTPLNKDIFSRDFTINTLIFDPETQEIKDITGKGIDDIKNRILRTPLNPIKSLGLNPKNILRGIRFKVQFNMEFAPEYERAIPQFIPYVLKFLKEHPQSQMVQDTVKKAMSIDPQKTMEEFKRFGLWDYLPKFNETDKYIKENFLGTTISPTGIEMKIEAQTKMIQHLLEEREKHKAYLRRKKRERKQKREKKFDILDKAKTGYYEQYPNIDPIDRSKEKSMGIPGREFIPKKRR